MRFARNYMVCLVSMLCAIGLTSCSSPPGGKQEEKPADAKAAKIEIRKCL